MWSQLVLCDQTYGQLSLSDLCVLSGTYVYMYVLDYYECMDVICMYVYV